MILNDTYLHITNQSDFKINYKELSAAEDPVEMSNGSRIIIMKEKYHAINTTHKVITFCCCQSISTSINQILISHIKLINFLSLNKISINFFLFLIFSIKKFSKSINLLSQ